MKKLWIWLVLGLILRLLLMPVSLHPDFRAVNLAGFLIAQKGEILSFYDHLSRLPRTDQLVNLYGDNLFIYPPLAYITHGIFNFLFFRFYPQAAFWTLINDIGLLRQTAGFAALMIWLKLPYLLADLLCFWLLLVYTPLAKRHMLIWFWWFNPVVLYTCYLMGQFDIFISLFILISLLFSAKKPLVSAIFLGIAAGFKPFPLLLLPFVPGSKIKNIITGLGTYFLIIAPFLGSPAFKQYALLASQTDKMFFARIAISGSQYLPVFLIGLILLYWWNYYSPGKLPVWGWFSATLLLFYSLTHYHPQWFIWVMPVLVILVIKNSKFIFPVISLILLHIGIVLFFETSLNFGLFGINYSLFTAVNSFYSADQLVSVLRALLFATSASLVLSLVNEKSS